MRLNHETVAIDITPVPIYSDITEEEIDRCFHFQGNAYFLSAFTRVGNDSIMANEGWQYFYLIDLYRSLVFRKYNDTDMLSVALVEIPREDLESLILQILFGGKHD